VFDVGNWDNCTWIVVGGASGDPASPHYTDQHQAWSRCELIPMKYDWDTIAASPQLTLHWRVERGRGRAPDTKARGHRTPTPLRLRGTTGAGGRREAGGLGARCRDQDMWVSPEIPSRRSTAASSTMIAAAINLAL
jgi:hypothetical protein